MNAKYALVIADDAELIMKQHAEEFPHGAKKADWLYDGIVYREDVTTSDLKDAVFANESFFPSVVIDGHQFIVKEKFTEKSWRSAVGKFIDLTSKPGDISFWTF